MLGIKIKIILQWRGYSHQLITHWFRSLSLISKSRVWFPVGIELLTVKCLLLVIKITWGIRNLHTWQFTTIFSMMSHSARDYDQTLISPPLNYHFPRKVEVGKRKIVLPRRSLAGWLQWKKSEKVKNLKTRADQQKHMLSSWNSMIVPQFYHIQMRDPHFTFILRREPCPALGRDKEFSRVETFIILMQNGTACILWKNWGNVCFSD